MTADALATDRLIGMVLLRPGWEHHYEERPDVYAIGCSGLITHAEQLPDGRYNLVLRGIERFRILEIDDDRSYRRAAIEPLTDRPLTRGDGPEVSQCRARLEAMLAPAIERSVSAIDAKLPVSMSDEDLVNALAQYLDLEPLEKQALLEQPSLLRRASALIELLEMKTLAARAHCGSGRPN